MPINSEACSGPCNRMAREDWNAYDAAVDQHAADMTTWLNLPGDDRGARPEPPQQPTTTVTLGEPVWCSRCPRIIRAALQQINDLAAALAANIDGHRGGTMAGPNGVAAPDHKTVIDTLDDLYGFLVLVEDQWRQARGYPARPQRARGSHARNLAVAFLLDQLDDILLHPGSVEFGLHALRWQRALLKMTKSDPISRRSPIRCPRCKERQVRRRDDDYYECDCCGRLLNQAEHDREYAEQADEHEQQEVTAS